MVTAIKHARGESMPEDNDAEERDERIATEPPFVKVTGYITDTSDPEQAGRMADMLLLFLAAGGTVSGTFIALFIFLAATKLPLPTAGWIIALLGVVFVGAMVGCAAVMRLLHAKGMIRWEQQRRP
jgi:hypothetical protein